MLPPPKTPSPVALAALLIGCLLPSCGGESTAESIGGDGADPLATPLPEPPAFAPDTSKIDYDPAGTGLPGTIPLAGSAGAVPEGARIIITNLATGDSATTMARDDGSFSTSVVGTNGDYLRVEFETNEGRSPHANLLVGETLTPVDFDDCVQLSPDGYADGGPIVIENACDGAITIVVVTGFPASVELSLEPDLAGDGLELSPGDSLSVSFDTEQSLLVVVRVAVGTEALPYSVVVEP